MKLILAVVEEDMTFDAIKTLSAYGYRTTKFASTGRFFKKGNSTLLLGVEDEQVDDVIRILKLISDSREKEPEDDHSTNVNCFVLPMEDFQRF